MYYENISTKEFKTFTLLNNIFQKWFKITYILISKLNYADYIKVFRLSKMGRTSQGS